MNDPFAHGPRAPRPAQLPPVWPPIDLETGLVDLSDDSDPPDGFFSDPDVARRMAQATTVAQGLSPAESRRDSNRKLSELTRAQWDLDVRRRAYEDAKAFSFAEPHAGRELVLAELSPEQAAKLDGFTGQSGLEVEFPPEFGGYFARVRDPVENVEIGDVPRGLLLAMADDSRGSVMIETEAGIPEVKRESGSWISRFLSSSQTRDMVLDLLPIIGNIRSGIYALESFGEAIEALRREDWGGFFAHGGMGLVNTLGALAGPFGGPLIRIIKAGIRRFVDMTPGVRQAAAAWDIKKALKAGETPLPGFGVERLFRRTFDRLTVDQQKLLKGMYPNIIGRAGERHAFRQYEKLGQTVVKGGPRTRTSIVMGGKKRRRHYDGLIEDVQHNIWVKGFKLFHPKTRRAALEVKVNSSSYRKQKPIDEAVVKDGTFVQEVDVLRYPVKSLSPKDFESVIREMLSKHTTGKHPRLAQKDVDSLVKDMNRLHQSGWDWVTAEVIVGLTARGASYYAAERESKRRSEDSGKGSSAKSGFPTARSGRGPRRRRGAVSRRSAKSSFPTARSGRAPRRR